MPQRGQRIADLRYGQTVVEQMRQGADPAGVDHFLGGDGVSGPALEDGSVGGAGHGHMNRPPVTSMTVPVMYEDRSEARNSATLAISSTSPARPIGISTIF